MPKPNKSWVPPRTAHRRHRICLSALLLAVSFLPSGSFAQDILSSYCRIGLDSNLALKQKNFDWEKARVDLKRAQAMFYPQAGFSSQYTLANGGRSQDIPIGDLLNNVYSTLNQLTASNKFPQVANQSIKFLPNDYHDTKMEVSMPVINPDIRYNKQVRQELINTAAAGYDIYRRELIQRIKQAYYQYLQADKAVAIYRNALGTVNENLRVSQKFVQNQMATREMVLRAETQVSQVEASLVEAVNNLGNAAAYFNFLLNRPLETTLLVDSSLLAGPATADAAGSPSAQPADPLSLPAIAELPAAREELVQMGSTKKVLETNLRWSRSYTLPHLNAFYDIGFQGFGYHFNGDQFYQLGGLQLQWNLFRGGDNKYKIRQAEIDREAIDDQYKDLGRQLTLQVQTALNNYRSAGRTLPSLEQEVLSARETYRFTDKRFREGQALQIELIDARTRMTEAELRYSLGRLALLNRAADLERATASYKF